MTNQLYMTLPPFLQSLAITLYGAKTYRDRFGSPVPTEYAQLEPPFSRPTDRTFDAQNQRLKALIAHCVDFVPYYKRTLRGRTDWRDIDINNLSHAVPKITKRDVLRAPEDFMSTHPDFRKPLRISTSGTSGTPLTIYASREARRINYAFYERMLNTFGLTYRTRSTTLAGRMIHSSNTRTVGRYDKFNNTQYLSVYDISNSTIAKYVAALNKWEPRFIDSYPSALFELQLLARKANIGLKFAPDLIITSSETLTPQAREAIESFFNTKVYDHYGCAEMVISAFSDGEKYYSHPLYSILELENKYDDRYSLIATGLLNFAMPLIRYEVGDSIVTDDPSNPYIFSGVDGRMDDVIVTPEGKMIGRLGPAFKGTKGIELAQVIQEEIDKITVNVVLKSGFEQHFDEVFLAKRIKEHTSPLINVKIQYCDNIPKETSGKYKEVISKIESTEKLFSCKKDDAT